MFLFVAKFWIRMAKESALQLLQRFFSGAKNDPQVAIFQGKKKES
jgi:hypothetical protein